MISRWLFRGCYLALWRNALSLFRPTCWKSGVTATQTYEDNGLNQYTTIDGVAQQHDGNGNLADDGQWQLEFDGENRLITAANADVNMTYHYDAEGRRLEKDHNGTVNQYLYDGADLIAVYDNTGNLIQRYVHGPGVDEPVVGYEYDTQGEQQAKRWYYANHQGSVIATADAAGDVEQVYTYSAFGVPGEQGSSLFRYTGQVWDEEAQLAYYKARYYSPTRGRFLSTDPAGFIDSMNLYAYVVNDPVNLTDPTGNCPSCIGALIGGGLDLGIQLYSNGGDLSKVNYRSVAVSAGLGAFGNFVAGKAASSFLNSASRSPTKEFIGEAGAVLKGLVAGRVPVARQVNVELSKSFTRVDQIQKNVFTGKNVLVEAKFSTSGRPSLTAPQRLARKEIPNYRVVTTPASQVINSSRGVGSGIGVLRK